jgi:hypothetical protein
MLSYGSFSTLAAAYVVGNALRSKPNFYAAAVTVGQSSGALMVLANFVLFVAICCGMVIKSVFFGTLRRVEVEVSGVAGEAGVRPRGERAWGKGRSRNSVQRLQGEGKGMGRGEEGSGGGRDSSDTGRRQSFGPGEVAGIGLRERRGRVRERAEGGEEG